ncbi:MAG: hypothetical protein ACFB10_19595 [Salibacteraceae bacterium]
MLPLWIKLNWASQLAPSLSNKTLVLLWMRQLLKRDLLEAWELVQAHQLHLALSDLETSCTLGLSPLEVVQATLDSNYKGKKYTHNQIVTMGLASGNLKKAMQLVLQPIDFKLENTSIQDQKGRTVLLHFEGRYELSIDWAPTFMQHQGEMAGYLTESIAQHLQGYDKQQLEQATQDFLQKLEGTFWLSYGLEPLEQRLELKWK